MAPVRVHRGVSLAELLVTIGIIAVVVSLMLPAVQLIRAAARKAECMNKMRQLGLACHHYAGDHGTALPTYFGYDTTFFKLLPYVEQDKLYREIMDGTRARENYPVAQFRCPVDPTIESPHDPGSASYAANALIFLRMRAEIPATIRDGLSHTILFSHHYAFSYREAAAAINYTQFDWLADGTFPQIPGRNPGEYVLIRRATFAEKEAGDVYPVTQGNRTVGSVRGLTFQARPSIELCDPRIANSPHNGLPVALADGSIQFLSRSIAEEVYWALVTPAGGEVVDDVW